MISDINVRRLTLHAMNSLYQADQDEGCCHVCCAPCEALWEMFHLNQLDDVLRDDGPGHYWWIGGHQGGVSTAFLASAWRNRSCHE